jgi:hypothetical protein
MSTNRRETVTIRNLQGQADRVTLPDPHWEGSVEISGGRESFGHSAPGIEALYVGPTSGRMFARFFDIDPARYNERQTEGIGELVDFLYRELTREQYLGLCLEAGVEPVGTASEGMEV